MAQVKQRSQEATDRERIAMAFGELSERGYLLPFAGWEVCCASCGWTEVALQTGADEALDPDLKTVWWDEKTDAYAFCDDVDFVPQTQHFLHTAPSGKDVLESDEALADSVLARITEYATLVSPLFIHWRGDSSEIAAALRAQGLRVQVPPSMSQCIVVLPETVVCNVKPVNGEVVLEIDDEAIPLTVADARRLVRKLNRAARLAEFQMPVL